MIAGGYNHTANQKSNEIYDCLSNDINSKNNNDQSIWQLSLFNLPFAIDACQCIITDKKSKNPKLIILGGRNGAEQQGFRETSLYFEYNLCDIIDYDTFNHFIIDIKQVYLTLFLIFVLFCFCWFKLC